MIFQSMFCGSVEMEENVWQGSVVVDIEFKVSVVLFFNLYEKMIYLLEVFNQKNIGRFYYIVDKFQRYEYLLQFKRIIFMRIFELDF